MDINDVNIVEWGKRRDMGVVRHKQTGHLLFGWSMDEAKQQVHILGLGGMEWRGTDLKETIETALKDIG